MKPTASQTNAWHAVNQAKVKKQIKSSSNMRDLSLRLVELLDKKLIVGAIVGAGINIDKKKAILTIEFERNLF